MLTIDSEKRINSSKLKDELLVSFFDFILNKKKVIKLIKNSYFWKKGIKKEFGKN